MGEQRRSADSVEAIERLDGITRRLRRDCPWDREQDERSIVPHTVEEAYELADAAHSGDDAKLLDELGDVLFQVLFLSMLMEERSAGSLAEVADLCREKLIRRHPHVFGEEAAATAGEVLELWGRVKREDERAGELFGSLPENLPSTLYAKKVLRRAASAGYGESHAGEALAEVKSVVDEFWSPGWESDEQAFDEVGRLLFHAVEAAAAAGVDPEVALRQYARAYKEDVEAQAGASG
ncbi:MAG: nucleoside triphosphate pyrophosphohydrolase [Solirubrobacterales bacterium]|nr:nucleoside triphosphate pyrophosphohydrolase [Solirubrobacterales bacterium]